MEAKTNTQTPTLMFFRHRPEVGKNTDGLFSSLQAFESSLVLLAFRRYPSALVQSISAVESLLRGYFKCANDPEVTLNGKLLPSAGRKHPRLREIMEKTMLQDAVQLRNDIIHSGHSPKDDAASVDSFTGSVLPYYQACLKEMYEFDLLEALFEDYRRHIDWARKAFYEARRCETKNRVPAISALTAFMRWQEMQCIAPEGSYGSLHGCTDEGFQRTAQVLREIERQASNPWVTECPVCDAPQSMIVDLDGYALDDSKVTGTRAECANCSYTIGGEWGFMVDILLGDQLEKCKDEIIKTIVG